MVPLILIIALFGCAVANPFSTIKCGKRNVTATLSTLANRIVGGTEAEKHSWPWQIQIRYNGGHFCGASILTPEWILSAAHCFKGFAATGYSFRAGRHSKLSTEEKFEQTSSAKTIIMHESYSSSTLNNDVAVIRLTTPFKFTKEVSPVCLPSNTNELSAGTATFVTGWGDTKNTGSSNVLREVMVPIISRFVCNQREYYNGAITSGMICAGYENGGKDSCQGDSGGPLVAKVNDVYEQHGIVSWGSGCAAARKPGVYANVVTYKNWIEKKIKQIEEEESQVEAKFQPRPFGSAFREQVQKMVLAGEIDDTDLPMGNDWLFKK